MRVYYSDHLAVDLPRGHRFPMPKYSLVRQALLDQGVLSADELYPAPLAEPSDLLLAHTSAYVQAVLDGSLEARIVRQIGLPWSRGLVLRSLASVGGSLAAARAALLDGACGNLAGGTHHASASEGAGFCVFNDLAVTALALLRDRKVQRIAIVDLDVHQGNGSAAILNGNPGVFTFSLHGQKNYPFRKSPSSLDIGLEDGAGDELYLAALERGLAEVLAFQPELVLYQAGVDPLKEDRLGRLAISMDGLAQRDRRVLDECRRKAVPVAIVLGGGYAEPIDLTVQAHVQTYQVLREIFPEL